jgi:hypothetical protein
MGALNRMGIAKSKSYKINPNAVILRDSRNELQTQLLPRN